ncbi:hypothetical protein BT69DRAFT_1284712 [Atractiella rhizophila]|nr:hypothetical protein BT69DRAFT_1284712 [Atractiella rhizophila]
MPRATRQQKILVKQVLFAAVVFIEFGALLTAVIVTATTGPEVSVPGKTTEEIDELLDLKGECMHYKDARGQIAYTVIGWFTWIITLLCFALDRLDHDNTTFRPGMHMHSEVDVPAPAMVDFNMAKTPQSMTMKRGLSEVSFV